MSGDDITDAMTPARLSVGLISAGRVGTALGEALERVGHVVSARTARGLVHAHDRLPDTEVCSTEDVARRAELLILAVPDDEVPAVVAELDQDIDGISVVTPGMIILHTAGSLGLSPLLPLQRRGAMILAVHPAMTFIGAASDTDHLEGCVFGVTATDAVGMAVAQSLVAELRGVALAIAEEDRILYHAALSHAVNSIATVVNDVTDVLGSVVERGRSLTGLMGDGSLFDEPTPGLVVRPLLYAVLNNVVSQGDDALSGPIGREDYATALSHIVALRAESPPAARLYRAVVRRTAQRRYDQGKIGDVTAYSTFMSDLDVEGV